MATAIASWSLPLTLLLAAGLAELLVSFVSSEGLAGLSDAVAVTGVFFIVAQGEGRLGIESPRCPVGLAQPVQRTRPASIQARRCTFMVPPCVSCHPGKRSFAGGRSQAELGTEVDGPEARAAGVATSGRRR